MNVLKLIVKVVCYFGFARFSVKRAVKTNFHILKQIDLFLWMHFFAASVWFFLCLILKKWYYYKLDIFFYTVLFKMSWTISLSLLSIFICGKYTFNIFYLKFFQGGKKKKNVENVRNNCVIGRFYLCVRVANISMYFFTLNLYS